jgi:hypothetical protein
VELEADDDVGGLWELDNDKNFDNKETLCTSICFANVKLNNMFRLMNCTLRSRYSAWLNPQRSSLGVSVLGLWYL